MGIRIQKRKPSSLQPVVSKDSWPKMDDAQQIALSTYLPDSCVANIYWTEAFHQQVDALVEESLSTQPVNEVGGFILGNCLEEEDGRWSVFFAMLQFATPESHSPTRLEIGQKAMLELEQALEKYQGQYGLVGWFHTHPGHSPYLSSIDLTSVHEPHFQKPYHVAVVLDSLTDKWDTGFFTRKPNLQMNNQEDYPLVAGHRQWYSWRAQEKL